MLVPPTRQGSAMSITDTEIMEITRHNVGVWDRCAPTYTDVFEPLTSQASTPLLDLAGVGRGTELLDIGTGPGTHLGAALARGAEVTAIDLVPAMVDAVRTRHPAVDARVADAHHLPFGDGTFSAVTIGFCLHHTADPHTVLREASRVLQPGGRLSFTVWDDIARLEAFGLGYSAFAGELPADDGPPPAPLGERPADYEALLARSGLVGPTARVLNLDWPARDGASLFDGFARYLDLQGLAPGTAAAIRAALDAAVAERLDASGVAHLANPAIVAAAARSS
jgi:SAM-dependent methyltransferase